MPLPRIIEHLLAYDPLNAQIGQGTDQTIATIPPLTRIILEKLPLSNDYADIVYMAKLDSCMIPNVFNIEASFTGKQLVTGVATEGMLEILLDSFVVISRAQPARLIVENTSNLQQRYSGVLFFISISTKEVMDKVLVMLKRVSTSESSEELLSQANRLLTSINAAVLR